MHQRNPRCVAETGMLLIETSARTTNLVEPLSRDPIYPSLGTYHHSSMVPRPDSPTGHPTPSGRHLPRNTAEARVDPAGPTARVPEVRNADTHATGNREQHAPSGRTDPLAGHTQLHRHSCPAAGGLSAISRCVLPRWVGFLRNQGSTVREVRGHWDVLIRLLSAGDWPIRDIA